jgi:ATP-binding cassette subfamily B protein
VSGQQSPATGEGSFAPVKGSLAAIIGLSLLGAASSVVPFIAIVELARALLPALEGGQIDAGRVRGIVLVAIGALLVSLVAAFTSGMVAHLASIHR